MKIKLSMAGLTKPVILQGQFVPGVNTIAVGPKIVSIEYFYENIEETRKELEEDPRIELIPINDKIAILRIGEELIGSDTVFVRFV